MRFPGHLAFRRDDPAVRTAQRQTAQAPGSTMIDAKTHDSFFPNRRRDENGLGSDTRRSPATLATAAQRQLPAVRLPLLPYQNSDQTAIAFGHRAYSQYAYASADATVPRPRECRRSPSFRLSKTTTERK